MTERDIQEHAWVDDWLRLRSGAEQWTPHQWKHHFFKLSTTLSYLLRHGARNQGMTISSGGYLAVAAVLQHWQFKDYTEPEILVAVEKNAKQRFALKTEGNVLFICAWQGHSAQVGNVDQSELTTPLDISALPELVIHGTFWSNLTPILKDGLKKMGRNHIHMAAGLDVTSGIRKESDTILKINVRQAMADGIEFMRSGNGVILSEGRDGVLSPDYIECVMDRSGRTVPDRSLPVPLRSKSAPKALPKQQAASSQSTTNGTAPLQPTASGSAPSQLSLMEKEFLKVAKKVRAILRLKEQKAAGSLAANQEKKLDTWDEMLAELRETEQKLSKDSDLREKNTDVLAFLL